MPDSGLNSPWSNRRIDLASGLVVAIVSLPLGLGVAIASGAPPISGLLAGIVGGLIVGLLSGSHTSVSGPSPGLTAVLVAEIAILGYEGFLVAVMLAGLLQITSVCCERVSCRRLSRAASSRGCSRQSV